MAHFFVRYLAIELNINCNRKIAEIIFNYYKIFKKNCILITKIEEKRTVVIPKEYRYHSEGSEKTKEKMYKNGNMQYTDTLPPCTSYFKAK